MQRDEARRAQYRRTTFYLVLLTGPNGEREELGRTQRKSGAGLMRFLQRESIQDRMKAFPGADALRFTKHADRLELSNGWRVTFGGTILQESE